MSAAETGNARLSTVLRQDDAVYRQTVRTLEADLSFCRLDTLSARERCDDR